MEAFVSNGSKRCEEKQCQSELSMIARCCGFCSIASFSEAIESYLGEVIFQSHLFRFLVEQIMLKCLTMSIFRWSEWVTLDRGGVAFVSNGAKKSNARLNN